MSYYVRKTAKGWCVAKQIFVNGQRQQKAVPREAWGQLGLSANMSIQDAQEVVRLLNKQGSAEKWARVRAISNHKQLELISSAYLPERQCKAFQEHLTSTYDPTGSRKLLSHWHAVQKLIAACELSPARFASDKQKVFNWMRKQTISLDYAKKLVRVLDLFGNWMLPDAYRPVGRIPAIEAQRLRDAHLDADANQASEPLTPQDLIKLKEAGLPEKQLRWLECTIWFGLRPGEVDRLRHSKLGYKTEFDKALKILILSIYQAKLVSVPREQRWKHIPVFLPEQVQLLKYIDAGGELKRPLNKVLKRHLGRQVTCYGGRKGFIDLMLHHNQALEDVSAWLGHQSIEMSWRRYRNRARVNFKPPKAG